jgi:co-chaperonin GroES (HSP10)
MENNLIIVKPKQKEEVTKSGIIIFNEKPKKYSEGVVVKVGVLEQDISVGDTLAYTNNVNANVDFNGEKCHVINEFYVLAKIG